MAHVGLAHAAGVAIAAARVAGQTPLASIQVAAGLEEPLYATHAPGDFERLFIVERGGAGPGRVRILDLASGAVLPTPLLSVDVHPVVGEEGLFSLAFHPEYESNGFLYVCHTTPGPGQFVIQRYTVSGDPNVADPLSGFTVLRLPQEGHFHNGGWIGFGGDGYLFAAIGDNGDPVPPQITENNLRGKMVRLDVDGDAYPGDPDRNYAIPPGNPFVGLPGDDEIWAYGLRNPWRASVDRKTQDLWIGDVGQFQWEEISLRPAPGAGQAAPTNFGWICYDGPVCTALFNCGAACQNALHYSPPVHYYQHGGTPHQCSVTGGYVYRGCAIPDLRGTYFFGDFCAGRVWSLRYEGGQVASFTDRTAELNPGGGLTLEWLASFGEDAFGEVYLCTLTGRVFKIVPASFVGPDCNRNQVRDECDIMSGFSADLNGDGIPDECEACYADCTGEGSLSIADFGCFQARFVQLEPYADCTCDGNLSIADFACFQSSFVKGCP